MSASDAKPRRRRAYLPTFEGAIEGWLTNYLTDNLWRVARTMERRDCMQEAYIVFMRVAARYPDVEAKHFFALFRTSWTRVFDDLSVLDSRVREREVPRGAADRDDGPDWRMERAGELSNEGELLVALRQAPREVRMVLDLMLRAPQEVVELALSWRPDRGGRRSDRLCELLGLPPDRDVLGDVHAYFGSR